ncbi:MAG: class I SAM-dependent methyltransferase [Bacteroidota bacterium]
MKNLQSLQSLRNLWYSIPVQHRYSIRRLYFLPRDISDRISGKRNKYIPPVGLVYTGTMVNPKQYMEHAQQQVDLLKDYTGLKPDDTVLDMGSGIGRTATALIHYLNENGSYYGFDVIEKGVKWCNKHIQCDFPNFHFKYVPLHNDLYNNSGENAENFKFPYADHFFDKIFSYSLFTHMQIEETQNYFHEIKRTLKPGGYSLSTFFIYDDAVEDYISSRKEFNFPYKKDGYRLMSNKVKAGNVAIHQDKLQEMLDNAGLKLVKIQEGFWKEEQRSKAKWYYQDVVVVKACDK